VKRKIIWIYAPESTDLSGFWQMPEKILVFPCRFYFVRICDVALFEEMMRIKYYAHLFRGKILLKSFHVETLEMMPWKIMPHK
jgi:hypothetical protein